MPLYSYELPDLESDLEFDKFMDEILIKESAKTVLEDADDHPIRKRIRENTDKTSSKIRYSKK